MSPGCVLCHTHKAANVDHEFGPSQSSTTQDSAADCNIGPASETAQLPLEFVSSLIRIRTKFTPPRHHFTMERSSGPLQREDIGRGAHRGTSKRCCRRTCSPGAAWPAAGWRCPALAGLRWMAQSARAPLWPGRPPEQTRSAAHLPTRPGQPTTHQSAQQSPQARDHLQNGDRPA